MMARKLLNGTLFNVCWFAVVMLQHDLWSWVATSVYLAVHVAIFKPGRAELMLLALVAAGGFLLDQLMFAAGILVVAAGTAPLWLSALWPAFASTLMHAFAGLREHLWLAALVGGFGGYGSYRLGASLSDVELGSAGVSTAVLLVSWGLLFPLLLVLAGRLERGAAAGSADAQSAY
ncbi:DUF2878 domain-containing protein [Halioglobus maricola]|nr:DUF2878 domain-containing protein [Halioglobus maricola]